MRKFYSSRAAKGIISVAALILLSENSCLAQGQGQGQQSPWLRTGNMATSQSSQEFIGYSNTGVLKFKTDNLEQMRITETGNVGIGIISPLYKLDLAGGNARMSDDLFVGGKIGIGTLSPVERLEVLLGNVKFHNELDVLEKIYIGPRLPPCLECVEPPGSGGAEIHPKVEVNGGLRVQRLSGSGNVLVKANNEGILYPLAFSGSSSQVLLGNGSFGAPPTFDWNVSGSNLLLIPSGNVGIGTSNVTEKLTVQGNTKVSGTLTANCVNTGCLNVTGQTSFEELNVNDKINTAKIVPLAGDSIVLIGDSSIAIVGNSASNQNAIYTYYKGGNGRLFIQNQNLTPFNINDPLDQTNSTIINPYFGRVGIGTVSPSTKLDVNGNIHSSGKISAGAFTSNSPLLFEAPAGTERMRINDANGYVGIGTTDPEQTLDVRSRINVRGPGYANTDFTGIELINDGTDLYSRVDICFKNIGPTFGNLCQMLQNEGSTNSFIFRNNLTGAGEFQDLLTMNLTSNNIIFNNSKTSGATYGNVFIPNGSVAIGTGINAPSAKLQLEVANPSDNAFAIYNGGTENFRIKGNGIAYAREVFIYAQGDPFPDYVFEENYSLAGWEKERNHWKKHKHLLGMQSATEVEKAGAVGMKDMQLNTLKKLEELYLYTDELRNYVDELNKKVEILTEENQQLKEQIKKDSQK